jgi:hypothetical protein
MGRIWDVPIVRSNGLTGNELVAGDAEQAGYIGVRQPSTLSVSDSDQDEFLRNRLTARVEGRFVPVIKVPSALGRLRVPELVGGGSAMSRNCADCGRADTPRPRGGPRQRGADPRAPLHLVRP